jgi:hypothetical protein
MGLTVVMWILSSNYVEQGFTVAGGVFSSGE